MQTRCVRQGQIEVGIIENESREFSALGATVQGHSITGYTKLNGSKIHLSTWCGQTMLASRCVIVQRFWFGSLALMFRLSRGRYIVGYALGVRLSHEQGRQDLGHHGSRPLFDLPVAP